MLVQHHHSNCLSGSTQHHRCQNHQKAYAGPDHDENIYDDDYTDDDDDNYDSYGDDILTAS